MLILVYLVKFIVPEFDILSIRCKMSFQFVGVGFRSVEFDKPNRTTKTEPK